MIVFVDLEHDRLRRDSTEWERSLATRLKIAYRLEEISGDICLIIRYPRVTPQLLRQLAPRAVLVSGCATDFEHYAEADLAGLRQVFTQAAQPIMGFCGGCQLMAQTYGADIGPLGPLEAGEPDPYEGAFVPGMKQERGFMPVRVADEHPLFDGLSRQPVFYQSHYWEVRSLPDGFRAFAQSDLCKVQAIAHRSRILLGTQFHPELYDDGQPDGRRVLQNFFRLAGILT